MSDQIEPTQALQDGDAGASASGPGCEPTASAAQEGVFAESHPSRELAALQKRLERMTAEPGWLTFYMQKSEARLIVDHLREHRSGLRWLFDRAVANGSLAGRYRKALAEIAAVKAGCASAVDMRGKARWALRDTDGSPKGPDRNGLDGAAATAGAEGIAKPGQPPRKSAP